MCWESSTAKTYDTSIFYDVYDLLLGQLCGITVFPKTFHLCVSAVIFNYDTICHGSVDHTTFLHSLYSTRYGTDYWGRNKTTWLSDSLAYQHLITFFNQCSGRSSDMLG